MVKMMKLLKIYLPFCLALVLTVMLISGANADSLLQRGSQAVTLRGTSDSSGILPMDNFWAISPQGQLTQPDFGQTNVVVVTHVIWRFSATSAVSVPAELRIGPYYSDKIALTDGIGGDFDNLGQAGIIVGNVPEGASASVFNLNTGETIPGLLTVQVVGYVAPAQ
jgi:hypothetical protein